MEADEGSGTCNQYGHSFPRSLLLRHSAFCITPQRREVIVQIVKADDLMLFAQQALGKMQTDESGNTSNTNRFQLTLLHIAFASSSGLFGTKRHQGFCATQHSEIFDQSNSCDDTTFRFK